MEKNNDQQWRRSVKLLRSFADVQKNMMRFVQKTAADNGLSVPQYSILATMAPYKEMTQKSIGEKTFLPKSTLSQAVDGLVRTGWLYRQQVEGNRRETLLLLSEKGEAFFKAIYEQEGSIYQVFQSAVELLTEEQYKELLKAHSQITAYLETQMIDQGETAK